MGHRIIMSERMPQTLHDVVNHMSEQMVSGHAGKAHYEIVDYLSQEGFFCECEHPIYFSDGTQERIDIMAHRDGMILAIEVDARYKRRSVERLRRLKGGDTYLAIVILTGAVKELPEGIDAIVIPDPTGEKKGRKKR